MGSKNNHIITDTPITLTDTVVFDQIYKCYYHPLCFYASKFVQPDDAQDIIENLFLKLWNKKQVFNSTEHMQSFLYLAVRNACFDFIKVAKNTVQRHTVLFKNHNVTSDDHLDSLIKAEVLGEIYRAINNLPSQCSKVISMSYLEGLNNSDIAAELGLSEQTVKNYKGRGLILLKDKLSGNTFTLLLLFIPWNN
jgi:RNA polymerase sigma-70 factor (family 1)